ncbi:biotin--[acetyl-CoA-carboxylase] ligase [Mycolicibacterium sp.]|uniref:biotin--[acetyl-CoA-carboxylase] ligase n=1 Tax=Mycolicibacterium sp. TaxID=2320850 RepID=UPI0028A61C72|nr:biotin--[acetyl-CoA-carboxylase] ligase [Mycolicibacterium sp.]
MDRPALDVAGVRRDLVGPDRPLRRLELVESTGSTNADLLTRHAEGEDIRGVVLVAEHQSAGRGRHGRSWSTPALSQIAFSLGIDAGGLQPAAWGWLPLLTGVAVVDAVRATTGVAAGLKWPNDIQVGERKLGGILAELAAPVIVVGLGLNVTLTAPEIEEAAPNSNATSLLMLGSTMLDRSALLGSILAELTARIDRWKVASGGAGGPDPSLIADYRSRSLTLGSRVRATLPGDREIIGTATDISELGQLRIDTGTDTVAVSAGDITHLRAL